MQIKQTSTVHVSILFQTPLYQKGPQMPVAELWLRTPTSLPRQLQGWDSGSVTGRMAAAAILTSASVWTSA